MTLRRLKVIDSTSAAFELGSPNGPIPVIEIDDQTGQMYAASKSVSVSLSTNLLISQFNPHADGVTDDSAAFTAAQAALSEVWLDAGKSYFIGTNLTLTMDVRFLAGAKIIVGNGANITFKGQIIAPPRPAIVADQTFTQTVADAMQRANESPMSDGGNWAQLGGAHDAGQLVSHFFQPTTAGQVSGALWTGSGVFPANQYSEITIQNATSTGNTNTYAIVRGSTSGAAGAYTCYFAWVSGMGANANIYIFSYVAGTGVQLYASHLTVTAGDKLRLAVSGSMLYLYYNGVLQAMVQNSAVASGYPGIAGFTPSTLTNSQISAWTGGSFSGAGAISVGTNNPLLYGEWFGAVGDGATSDYLPFQIAINALSGAGPGYNAPPSTPGGGTVVLLDKTYAIGATLNVAASWVNIVGQGRRNSTLAWTGPAGNIDMVFISGTGIGATAQVAFNRFSDFMVTKAAGGGTPQSLIHIANAIVVEFMRVDAIGSAGITNCFFADVGYYNMYFEDCLASTGVNGFNLTSPGTFNSGRLIDCVTTGCTNGFNIQSTGAGAGIADIYLIRCEDAGSGIGCKITSNSQGGISWSNDNVHLLNCIFDNESVSCLQVTNVYGNAAYIDCDSCYFAAGNSSGPIVDIENSCVQLRGCFMRTVSGTLTPQGLVLFNGAHCSGSICAHNQIINVTTGTAPYLIKLNSATGVVIQGNMLIGQDTTEPFTNGIWLVGSILNTITGNMVRGWGTTGLVYDATSNNNASTGNAVDTTHITTAKSDSGTGNGAGV